MFIKIEEMEWFVIRQLFTIYLRPNDVYVSKWRSQQSLHKDGKPSEYLHDFSVSIVPVFPSVLSSDLCKFGMFVCFFYFILVDLYDSEFCVPLISVEIFHIFVKGPAEAGYGIFSRLVKVLMGLFSALCSGSLWWHIHTTDRQYCAWFALNFNISLK